MHYYRKLHPGEPRFIWKNELAAGFAPVQVLSAELNSIYSMPVQARPSTYCLDQFGADV
jgi:hypothetical protein